MGSHMVRVRDEDIASIIELSGLEPHLPFSAKVHAVLQRLRARGDLDVVRMVFREELERVAGAR